MNINTSNIVLVGGCALNKTAVGKLESVWDDIWVPKNPKDPGSCIGVLLAQHHKHIDNSNEMWYNKEHGKQNKDYGYDIQKLYLEMMLQNAETSQKCSTIFDRPLFDRKSRHSTIRKQICD